MDTERNVAKKLKTLFMMDHLKDEHFTCGLDNLFISTNFCKEAMFEIRRVMLHGVCRLIGKGLHNYVVMHKDKINTFKAGAWRSKRYWDNFSVQHKDCAFHQHSCYIFEVNKEEETCILQGNSTESRDRVSDD